MNIARVEYYFAEMLSILEMPSRDEWVVDLVPSGWPNDPKHIDKGRFRLPQNMWFIGTANNDDSTFAISDKVYDRAMPININSKGVPFDAPDTDGIYISFEHLEDMFHKAQEENRVSQENLDKIDMLDDYVIEHFRLAFGNRIVKQLKEFVPAYIACGGTELDGLDYVLCNKILRKFESLNLSYIRDEIDGLILYLSEQFGEDAMTECKDYLTRLKKLF
jgi:5-methylcytosine-specific restriction endonuclease McrBC GTP-binding regulatory subunit McrB